MPPFLIALLFTTLACSVEASCSQDLGTQSCAAQDKVPDVSALLQQGPLTVHSGLADGGLATESKSEQQESQVEEEDSQLLEEGAGENVESLEDEDTMEHAQARHLKKADFAKGTLRLTQPGTYILDEDISFDPKPATPPLHSKQFKQGDGYFLGFFAAIAIEGDNISLNCKGRTIEMSKKFHKQQRFFSIIELGSRPFIPNAGPPPLADPDMSPGTLRPARNVKIINCQLGRSSHHGIHGNSADGVKIKNTNIKDFEVAGISLNGAQKVTIANVKIGPSMNETFPASLSQAIFLNHMCNTVGMSDPFLKPLFESTSFTLRGKNTTVATVFGKLRSDLKSFLEHGTGALAPLLGKLGRPDGSAIYGVLLHKSGPAVGDFGACPMKEFKENNFSIIEEVKLRGVEIFDLTLAPEAWISLHQGEHQVQGPAGAVFRATALGGTNGEYVGNALSDAMVAVGHLLDSPEASGNNSAAQRATLYYSAAFIPKEILAWAAGTSAKLDLSKFTLKCEGDAMSHFNKGVVGLRLEYLKSPVLQRINIHNLQNFGGPAENEAMCKAEDYKGNDVRAMKITNTQLTNFRADKLVPGHNGKTIAIDDTKT